MSRARDIADLAGSADAGGLTGRNRIINGNMTVAQRGTSFSSISSDQYTLDRWTSSSAGGVSLNVSQQTATSSDNTYFASKHFARYQRNAVLSGFVHKVEDLQQFNNKTFTLSFWAKSADAGTNVALTVYTVNDGSSLNSYVTQTYVTNPTLSSTWQKYEVRLAFQDMYAYGYSGSHHLRLQFFDGSNAATFDLAEVQLEVGDTATPFEHEDYGTTLAKCQRYYQTDGSRIISSGGYIQTAGNQFVIVDFITTMRANPTLTFSNHSAVNFNTSNPVINTLSNQRFEAYKTATGTSNGSYYLFNYTADAEL